MDVTRGATPPPLDITFLDRNGIRITGDWFITVDQRFRVRDLDEVWTVSGPRNPLAFNALKAAGLVVVVAALAAPELDTVAGWLGVGFILAIPLTVAAVALRIRPRPLALWATYHGRTERLLESGSPIWFHQVCRALNRAREFNYQPDPDR